MTTITITMQAQQVKSQNFQHIKFNSDNFDIKVKVEKMIIKLSSCILYTHSVPTLCNNMFYLNRI